MSDGAAVSETFNCEQNFTFPILTYNTHKRKKCNQGLYCEIGIRQYPQASNKGESDE